MKTCFLKTCILKNLVESEMNKVKFSDVSNKKSQNRTLKRMPLVVTYHPLLNSLGRVFHWFHFEVPEKLVANLNKISCTV